MKEYPANHPGKVHPAALLAQFLGSIFVPGEKRELAIAVSGGVDSMVLLDAARVLQDYDGRLVGECWVFHVDHGLRADSPEDAAFVAKAAQDASLPWEILPVAIDRDGPGSLEEKARVARYQALFLAMKKHGLKHLLTAQHQDDLAETVMLQHLRGSDLLGLGGMPAKRFIVQNEVCQVHRPFLQLPSSQLKSYAKEKLLSWREDHSNDELRHRRNLVRNVVLPMLSSPARGSQRERLTDMAKRVKSVNQTIVKMAVAVEQTLPIQRRRNSASKKRAFPIDAITPLPAEVSFHLIARQLDALGASGHALTPNLFARIITVEGASEVIELKRNLHAKTYEEDGQLWLSLELSLSDADANSGAASYPLSLAPGDRVEIPSLGTLEVKLLEEANHSHGENEQGIPLHSVVGNLVLRLPLKGEKMCPFGLRGKKLISDILQEARIEKEERWSRPLIADDEGVLWIPLVRGSERCRIVRPEGPFLHLRIVQPD